MLSLFLSSSQAIPSLSPPPLISQPTLSLLSPTYSPSFSPSPSLSSYVLFLSPFSSSPYLSMYPLSLLNPLVSHQSPLSLSIYSRYFSPLFLSLLHLDLSLILTLSVALFVVSESCFRPLSLSQAWLQGSGLGEMMVGTVVWELFWAWRALGVTITTSAEHRGPPGYWLHSGWVQRTSQKLMPSWPRLESPPPYCPTLSATTAGPGGVPSFCHYPGWV